MTVSDAPLELQLATKEQEVAAAYRERDALLALLASMYPAHFCNIEHSWSLLYLQLRSGQTSWPVPAGNRDLFAFLTPVPSVELPEWDSIGSDERLGRVREEAERTAMARAAVKTAPDTGQPEPEPVQEALTGPQEPAQAAPAPKRRGRPRKTAQAPAQAAGDATEV